MSEQIILGLGCNLGNREMNLVKAVDMICKYLLDKVVISSAYPNPPMLPPNAPDDWNIDYLNIVIAGELKAQLTPRQFLVALKEIETLLGRKPSERWAPREMDIDILAWGNQVIIEEDLQIPHLGMVERAFVMIPLAEILPEWKHPLTGHTALEYAGTF